MDGCQSRNPDVQWAQQFCTATQLLKGKCQITHPEQKVDGVVMRELKLPKAKQTHEIVYEPGCNSLFVSQLAESVLLRIKLSDDGKLTDTQEVEAWGIGPESPNSDNSRTEDVYKGTNELHNVSLSYKYKGCIWLSLEVPNLVLLINAGAKDPFSDRKLVIRLPDKDVKEGVETKSIGSPHVVREHPVTHEIWVGMKGPTASVPRDDISGTICACCDQQRHKNNYNENGLVWPTSWAVWHGKVEQKGGEGLSTQQLGLYTVQESPPMLDFCPDGQVVVSTDRRDTLHMINPVTKEVKTYKVPFPTKAPRGGQRITRKITGPGVVRSPDGQYVWCTLLGYNAAFLRIEVDCRGEPLIVLYHFPGLRSQEGLGLRFIHFDFDPEPDGRRMYALSSSILEDDKVSDSVVVIKFDDKWSKVERVKVLQLPTSKSKAHRIHFVRPSKTNLTEHQSLLVTEFTASMIVQIDDPKSVPLDAVRQKERKVGTFTHVTCSLAKSVKDVKKGINTNQSPKKQTVTAKHLLRLRKAFVKFGPKKWVSPKKVEEKQRKPRLRPLAAAAKRKRSSQPLEPSTPVEADVTDAAPCAWEQHAAPADDLDSKGAQELRDIYHLLVGKATGLRNSRPFVTKKSLMEEIRRRWAAGTPLPTPPDKIKEIEQPNEAIHSPGEFDDDADPCSDVRTPKRRHAQPLEPSSSLKAVLASGQRDSDACHAAVANAQLASGSHMQAETLILKLAKDLFKVDTCKAVHPYKGLLDEISQGIGQLSPSLQKMWETVVNNKAFIGSKVETWRPIVKEFITALERELEI